MRTSNCCDASGNKPFSEDMTYKDAGLCSDCGEHCEYENEKPDINNLNPYERWQLEKYGHILPEAKDIPDSRVDENGLDDLNRFAEWMEYMAERELTEKGCFESNQL